MRSSLLLRIAFSTVILALGAIAVMLWLVRSGLVGLTGKSRSNTT